MSKPLLCQPTYAIPIYANTLYSLMRRPENQGLLKSQWDTAETAFKTLRN